MAGLTHSADDPGLAIRSFDGSNTSLDVFKPEGVVPDGPTGIVRPIERPQVTLARLLGAGIVFDPIDAVAVGQALCRGFIGAQLRQRLNPGFDVAAASQPITLESILIDSGGRLHGAVGDSNDEAAVVRAIGTVMSEILRDGNRSALNTKIISKTQGSPPEFATVDALSKALDGFGGSNGREVLREVYELWRNREAGNSTAQFPEEPQAPAAVPPPRPLPPAAELGPKLVQPPKPPISAVTRLKQSRQFRMLVISAVVLAVVSGLGLGASFLYERLSAPDESATASVSEPEPTATEAGSPKGSATPGRQGKPAATLRVPIAPSARSAQASRPLGYLDSPPLASTSPTTAPNSAISARPSGRLERSADAESRTGVTANRPPASLVMPLVGLASDAAAPETSLPAIYGKDDTDVEPPKPLFPRLLKGLSPSSPNVRIDALTIAMVVSEDGTVESVHGLVAPQNIAEVVLLTQALSAVKSWRFQPAVRDGEPVKYRQIVPIKDLAAPQF